MDLLTAASFLAVVFVAAYVQSVTGFAMGMIVVAVVGGLKVIPLPVLTAAASLISLVNVVIALRGRVRDVHVPTFSWLTLGQIPGIVAGLWLLSYLDSQAQRVLYLLLGVFITAGSVSMILRPHARPALSNAAGRWMAGLCGGICGGLFSASGPVMGWFNYRQPLPVDVVRATLFACFVVTTSVRTVLVGATDGLTRDVLVLAAIALPVVVVATEFGRRYQPPWSDAGLKRAAFGLLIVMGVWIIGSAFQ